MRNCIFIFLEFWEFCLYIFSAWIVFFYADSFIISISEQYHRLLVTIQKVVSRARCFGMFFAKIQRHTSQNAISEGDLREQQVKVPCLHGTLRSAAITIKINRSSQYKYICFLKQFKYLSHIIVSHIFRWQKLKYPYPSASPHGHPFRHPKQPVHPLQMHLLSLQ